MITIHQLTAKYAPKAFMRYQPYYASNLVPGFISGTVTDGSIPKLCRVAVLEHPFMTLVNVKNTMKDGSYRFEYLHALIAYSVVAIDLTGNKNSVIAANITPERM